MRQQLLSADDHRPHRLRLSALTCALAAAGLMTVGSARAAIIFDTTHEPTNDALVGATAGAVGDTFTGCVGADINGFAPPCPRDAVHTTTADPEDFVGYFSLQTGDIYQLALSRFDFGGFSSMLFDLYRNGSAASSQTVTMTGSTPVTLNGLTGLTSLAIGIHATPNPVAEGYNVTLTQTGRQAVPEPATLALFGAGLVGALVARRKKRI